MTRLPVIAYIGLGANLGAAADTVGATVTALGKLPQTELLAQSDLYGSAPLHATGPDFVNAVVSVRTGLSARQLLAQLQVLEQQAGRTRPFQNAPRTLDLDLLLYGSACIQTASLQVPHPRMAERAFVLLPLAQIAPELVSPVQLAAVRTQRVTRL